MSEEYFGLKEKIQMLNFQMALATRKITVTYILLALMIGAYLLEEMRGGSNNIQTLVSMGANVSSLVQAGEYTRLMSCVFLHAGLMHIGFNGYVLYALGGFFNRILGSVPFLFIFLVSGITGSLASIFVGHSRVSVGSSGAIWGFFGASLVLAFFRNSVLPDPIRLSLRRTTLINLAINLGVSMLPMVDMWAHLGGGAGGFLSALVIVAEPQSPAIRNAKRIVINIIVAVLLLAYAVSFKAIVLGG